MRLFDAERSINRRMIRKRIPDLKPTGEPHPVKVGRGVRRGAVGKVLRSNSLAAYPTLRPAVANFGIRLSSIVWVVVSRALLVVRSGPKPRDCRR
jgi:hypothetical protein